MVVRTLFAREQNEKVSRESLTNHSPEDPPAYDSTWSYRPTSQRLWNDLCPLNHPILNDRPSTRNGWRRQSSISQTRLVTGGWLVRATTQLERKHHDHGRGDCRHHVPCLETLRRKRTQIQVPRAWQILPKSIVSLPSIPKANAAAMARILHLRMSPPVEAAACQTNHSVLMFDLNSSADTSL